MTFEQFAMVSVCCNLIVSGCLASTISHPTQTTTYSFEDPTTSQTLPQISQPDEVIDDRSETDDMSPDGNMTMMGYIKEMNMMEMFSMGNNTMTAMNYLSVYNSQRSMQDHKRKVTMEMTIDVSAEPMLEWMSSDSVENVNVTALKGQKYNYAGCEPYDQVIKIPNEKINVELQPSCIVIKRCGGCCFDTDRECKPTNVKDALVQVVKYVYLGNSVVAQEMVDTVKVVEHTACDCLCKVKESDCNSLQEYDDYHCKCECKKPNQSANCPAKMRWNSNTCRCQCREISNCAHLPGYRFDRNTCGCEHPNN